LAQKRLRCYRKVTSMNGRSQGSAVGVQIGLPNALLADLIPMDTSGLVQKAGLLGLSNAENLPANIFGPSVFLLYQMGLNSSLLDTPQARAIRELFGCDIFSGECFNQKVAMVYFALYYRTLHAVRTIPMLSDIKARRTLMERRVAEPKMKIDAADILLKEAIFGEITRFELESFKECEALKLQTAKLETSTLYNLEKASIAASKKFGGKVYARPLDWHWHLVSVFAASIYNLYLEEHPDAVARKAWGKRGNVMPYNNFLKMMGEGFIDNWETKKQLGRINPRPEDIRLQLG